MAYFDGIYIPSPHGFCESRPLPVRDSCFVFDMSRRGRLVACRTGRITQSPRGIGDIMSEDELSALEEYLMSYDERPMIVSTLFGWALAISWMFPSTSLCILSVADIGGEAFFRVASKEGWDVALSPSAAKRRFRITGIREGHREESRRLWLSLSVCFAPICHERDVACELRDRALAIAAYVSREARVSVDKLISVPDEIDAPLYVAFLLLLMLGGKASAACECAKISVSDRERGIEAVIIEQTGRRGARIFELLSEICGRSNAPFEYFCEDGRVYSRIVPLRRDWAYLGIKSPEE